MREGNGRSAFQDGEGIRIRRVSRPSRTDIGYFEIRAEEKKGPFEKNETHKQIPEH
jgi:hypothetical protein